jgi:hypothetical protein
MRVAVGIYSYEVAEVDSAFAPRLFGILEIWELLGTAITAIAQQNIIVIVAVGGEVLFGIRWLACLFVNCVAGSRRRRILI